MRFEHVNTLNQRSRIELTVLFLQATRPAARTADSGLTVFRNDCLSVIVSIFVFHVVIIVLGAYVIE